MLRSRGVKGVTYCPSMIDVPWINADLPHFTYTHSYCSLVEDYRLFR